LLGFGFSHNRMFYDIRLFCLWEMLLLHGKPINLSTIMEGMLRKKVRLGGGTPRWWGWGTPLKKRATLPEPQLHIYSHSCFCQHSFS
jgi:hypothetical protein